MASGGLGVKSRDPDDFWVNVYFCQKILFVWGWLALPVILLCLALRVWCWRRRAHSELNYLPEYYLFKFIIIVFFCFRISKMNSQIY